MTQNLSVEELNRRQDEARIREMAQNAARLRYNLLSDLIQNGSSRNCYDGQAFFTKLLIGGQTRRAATPLFVVLILVETTDLVFAVDSIPAIFAITTDPFIVLTSNVFAILGLRAMYFLLAGMHERFHLLTYGLAGVLVNVVGVVLSFVFDALTFVFTSVMLLMMRARWSAISRR